MSSAGQAVGGIVGAVVGFFTPIGPLYGAQIGIMLGGLIDPPRVPGQVGPRLEDLTIQTSTYGSFIPRVYGTVALSGNVIWIQGDKLIERSTTTGGGGKGGPSQPETTTFEYFSTFAVGLCEGPIAGVRRIWIGGQLWYDAGSDDLSTIIASNEVAGTFTLYTGSETQLADPLIQADRGIANVPAHRGIAYIVFKELPVKDYGNSLAGTQVKVEVVKNGAEALMSDTSILPTSIGDWTCAATNDVNIVALTGGNDDVVAVSNDGGVTWIQSQNAAGKLWTSVTSRGNGTQFIAVAMASTSCAVSNDGHVWTLNEIGGGTLYLNDIKWCDSAGSFVAIGGDFGPNYTKVAVSVDGAAWSVYTGTMPLYQWHTLAYGNGVLVAIRTGMANTCCTSTDGGVTWFEYSMPATANWVDIAFNGEVFCAIDAATSVAATSPDGVTWTAQVMPSFAHQTITWTGNYFLVLSGTTYAAKSVDGVTWDYYTTIPSLNVLAAVWSGAHTVAVGRTPLTKAIRVRFGFIHSAVPLSTIVQTECLKSVLLTAADLDVTQLTDQVRGYRVSSLAPLRGGIVPLRKAWPFDVVQAGYKIKFVKRGTASIATIDVSELDARAAGTEPGVQITNTREMDTVLPNQLTIKYLDATREYDINMAEESR